MVFAISKLNNCTYKLDANNQRVLMYAPLLSDGSYETAGSAYDWVEWDRLDPDVLEEADRIHKLLLAEVWLCAVLLITLFKISLMMPLSKIGQNGNRKLQNLR